MRRPGAHHHSGLAALPDLPAAHGGVSRCSIELLSRFRTPKQQEEIVKDLRRGQVDIVIGTHRVIQKDVQFKDLGLAIIDEEQRFGVAHKERFKELFNTVDVLTLSATPIPRTLNMAMSGIRDMSVIEEAPQDRHPVQTYVLEYDWEILAAGHPPGAAPGRTGVLPPQPGGDASTRCARQIAGDGCRMPGSSSPTAR